MGNAQHYRGIDVTDGVRDGNLRQIRRCRFENSQHSRGFDVPARGRAGDLRHIRRRSLRNRRHSRGFDAPGREKADTIEESQSRAPVLPCFLGPLGGQVVRFAGGARLLPRRTAKSRHIREPGRPVCVRHVSKIPCGAVRFCALSRAKSSFSAGILNTIEEVRSRSAKVTCFTVENGPPSRPPRNWQHYRGFDHLGRWGP